MGKITFISQNNPGLSGGWNSKHEWGISLFAYWRKGENAINNLSLEVPCVLFRVLLTTSFLGLCLEAEVLEKFGPAFSSTRGGDPCFTLVLSANFVASKIHHLTPFVQSP